MHAGKRVIRLFCFLLTLFVSTACSIRAQTVTANDASICNGSCATITAVGSGGTLPYTFSWSNGNNTSSITDCPSANTVYTVTLTDATGNRASTTAKVVLLPGVLASISATNLKCNGDNIGTATVGTANTGTPPYMYLWNNGHSSPSISGLSAGTYKVTVTDSKGCTSIASTTITQPPAISGSISSSPATCGSNNGSAVATASGGTGTLMYTWSNGTVGNIASALSAGFYAVSVKDANSCVRIFPLLLTNTGSGVVTALTKSNVSCNGGNNGVAVASISGGSGPFTYSWSNGSVGLTANGLAAGLYFVIVRDASLCLSGSIVNITQPFPLNITFGVSQPTCGSANGYASANVTGGTGPYNYSWSNGATTKTISALPAGNYTVSVADTNNCKTSDVVTLLGITAPIVTVSVNQITCNGAGNGSITLAVSSSAGMPYTYSWSNGVTGTTGITGLSAGTYFAIVTNSVGCVTSRSVVITEPPAIILSANSLNAPCVSLIGSALATTIGGTGAFTYSWSSGATGPTASGLTTGTYSLTAMDANGCSTTTTVAIINSAGTASTTVLSNVSCHGGSNGSASAGMSVGSTITAYIWSNGQTGSLISGITAGNYTVTITDSNGCLNTSVAIITEPPAIILSANSLNTPCVTINGSALATATGGTGAFTYSWSSGVTGQTVSGLTPGNYTVTVIDANACIKSTTVNIVYSGASAAVAAVLSNVNCHGDSNGSATVTLSGTNTAISYSWSNGAATQSISGVAGGSYTVTVTDNNSCNFTSIVVIAEPPQLTAAISAVNATSAASCDGSITSVVSGGVPVYSYQWSNSATTAVISGLCTGLYAYTITDSHGCEVKNSVLISDTLNTRCNLHFYNMITPNNDGNNDYWHIDCITAYTLNNVAIFNRWGNKIWQTDGYNNTDRAWKGTDQSGTAMPEGTYFYVVKVNSIEYSGKVELLK